MEMETLLSLHSASAISFNSRPVLQCGSCLPLHGGEVLMKNHFNGLIVFLVLMFIPTPVSAIPAWDGNELMNHCRHWQKATDRGFDEDTVGISVGMCAGLIGGYTDSMRDFANVFTQKFNLCIPNNAKWGQRIKVVIKYLEEHPEKLHMHYAILLLEAMSDAFPCNDQ